MGKANTMIPPPPSGKAMPPPPSMARLGAHIASIAKPKRLSKAEIQKAKAEIQKAKVSQVSEIVQKIAVDVMAEDKGLSETFRPFAERVEKTKHIEEKLFRKMFLVLARKQ